MKYVLFSMDCELAWGFADLTSPVERVESMRDHSSSVRNVYSMLIDLFDKYDIPATWAFVGHLFYDSCSESTHPVNDLTGGADPYSNQDVDPLYYAPDVIDMVEETDIDHDIGGHSFTHPEFTQIEESTARAELATMVDIAAERGIDISSFVFPRNSVAHINLLDEFGITSYRTGTVGTNYILRDGIGPFLRRDEQFWSIPPVSPERTDEGPVRIQASRLLHEARWRYLHPKRLQRTFRQMNEGEVAHFAFHPHDVLGYPRVDWVLDRILSIVSIFRKRNMVQPITLADVPEIV